MNSSHNGRITDELLSAYIDNAVTETERNLVEAAVAADDEVAWRLDTLEQTVQMLRSLPELALPRSFTLQESQLLSASPADAVVMPRQENESWLARMSSGWGSFWRSGSAAYRNLAAASLVLLLVLVGGRSILAPTMNSLAGVSAPAEQVAFSEAQAPAGGGEPAPQADAPQEEALAAEVPVPQLKPAASSDIETAPAEAMAEQDEAAINEAEGSSQAATMPANAGDVVPAAPVPMALAVEESDKASAVSDAVAMGPPAASPMVSASDMVSAASARMAPPPPADEAAARKAGPEGEVQTALARAVTEPSGYPEPSSMSMDDDDAALAAAGAPPSMALSAEAHAVEEPPPADTELAASKEVMGAMEAVPATSVSAQESMPSPDRESVLTEDSAASVAAVPTARPLATAKRDRLAVQTLTPAPSSPASSVDLYRLLAAALLVSSVLFGGLWWRSRATN